MKDLSISDIILILKSKEKEAQSRENQADKIVQDLVNLLGHAHIATQESKKVANNFYDKRIWISEAIVALEKTTNKGE